MFEKSKEGRRWYLFSGWRHPLGVQTLAQSESAKRSLMSCHAVRYVLLKNQKDLNAPVVLHFHGSGVELIIHEITINNFSTRDAMKASST